MLYFHFEIQFIIHLMNKENEYTWSFPHAFFSCMSEEIHSLILSVNLDTYLFLEMPMSEKRTTEIHRNQQVGVQRIVRNRSNYEKTPKP